MLLQLFITAVLSMVCTYLAMAEHLDQVLENLAKEGKLERAAKVLEKAAGTVTDVGETSKAEKPCKLLVRLQKLVCLEVTVM